MLEMMLWVIFAHYIADYPLQGSFLAQTKGKYFYSLFAHSIIYALTIALCFKILGAFTINKVYVLFVSHFVIDFFKSTAQNKEKHLTTYLYIDQLLHIVIDLILLFI